jgi:hypothetical protein
MEIKIKVSENEFVTKDVKSEKYSKDTQFVSGKKKRKHITDTTDVVVDWFITYKRNEKFYKENGYLLNTMRIFRVIPREEPVKPKVPIPRLPSKGAKRYIQGKALREWIKKVDAKYPTGWEAKPKGIIDDILNNEVIDALEQGEKVTLEELKIKLEEVDDFE